MTPCNTNTGGVLKAMVLPALERGGYECLEQVLVGQPCGGVNGSVVQRTRSINRATDGCFRLNSRAAAVSGFRCEDLMLRDSRQLGTKSNKRLGPAQSPISLR